MNFGGIDIFTGADGKSRFTVLPVPYDLTTTYQGGTRKGPGAIIEASTHMELYDEEFQSSPYEAGILTLNPLEPTAAGPAEMIDGVYEACRAIFETGSMPIVLGGEHSITFGLARAALERFPRLSVLQLDAHADMRDSYQGTPNSHACVARRISEICPIVQAGIRSLSVEEAEFLKGPDSGSVKTYYASMIHGGVAPAEIVSSLSDDVLVTVDIDVFDPSIMPATGTPEPGGLDWHQVTGILKEVAARKRVVGFDLLELAPIPGFVAPDFMASKLVYKMMAYMNLAAGL